MDQNATGQHLIRPYDLIEMDVAAFLTQTDQTVALERGHEKQIHAVDEFQIGDGSIPRIEEDGLGLDPFVGNCGDQHLAKMIVLGLSIALVIVDAIVDGKVATVLAVRMKKVDDVNSAHEPVFGSTVLFFNQFNGLRVLFILDAIVQNKIRTGAIVKQRSDKFPETAGRQLFTSEIVTYRIVACPRCARQMVRQVCASIVNAGCDQILNVLLLGQDAIL